MMPDIFVDLAKGLERACIDYMIIEDSSMVPYTYKGTHDTYLKYAASTPKLDPAVLVPHLAMATKHLGLVPTLSTSEYPPYLLARLVNSLDHTTEGRIGWNCVTSSNDGAAQNYGHEGQKPHDDRYEVADEFTDVVTRLWEAWEPDAVVLDRDKPMFADGSKVHPINHDGKYFKVRGPINAPRSPQGRVPICQAGGSPRGQAFAAKWADTIITNAVTVEGMKSFREDVRRPVASFGRDPDKVKVLFLAYPIIDSTMEAARERRRLRAGGGRPPSRPAAFGHVAPYQHRLLQVRSRRAVAGEPDHQRAPIHARQMDRQDAALAGFGDHQPPGRRHGRHGRSCGGPDAGDHAGGGRRRLPAVQRGL